MKQSKSISLTKLVKNYLEEEKDWAGNELIIDRPKPKPRIETAESLDKGKKLQKFKDEISNCRKCPLGKARLNVVFGVGNPAAELLFVGEGPGFDEDHKGEPFIGRAGKLLDKIIESMGYRREDVYIANIVKCHPMIDPSDPEKHGNDRPPEPEETAQCIPYLVKQIEIIHPKVICTLGSPSSKTLSGLDTPISKLRGNWLDYKLPNGDTIPLMPTFHPAALLRNPNLKKEVWADVQKIMEKLGKKIPKK